MSQVFKDFDLSSVWESDSWADENYQEAPFTPEILAAVESELGYKLPQSFIELMAVQNGGIFVKNCFPTTQRNSWAENHVQICEVSGIGFEKEGLRVYFPGLQFEQYGDFLRLIQMFTH